MWTIQGIVLLGLW